ncbi:MAG TPA: response regulator, partial [Chitinophagaceae bacterium]|nr:response regulator [Chitinophagaceae bacterium]
MKENILIVEDEFIVANDLRMTLEKADYRVCGISSSVNEARDIVKNERPSLVLLDIQLKGSLSGIDLAKELKEKDIPFIYLSANSNQQILEIAKATEPYGFLVKPYREKDLLVTLDIARYRYEHGAESRIRREHSLQSQLTAIVTEGTEWDQVFLKISKALQSQIPFDYIAGVTKTEELKLYALGFLRIGFEEYQQIGINELSTISGLSPDQLRKLMESSPASNTASFYNGNDFEEACLKNPAKKMLAETFDLRSSLVMPVLLASGGMFAITFFSRKP